MVACAHDSISDDLLLHNTSVEPSTPVSPVPTPTGNTPSQAASPEGSQHPQQGQQQGGGGASSGRPDLTRSGSRHWEMGPHGISRLSSSHNLSRLSPSHRLSRLSPLRSLFLTIILLLMMTIPACLDLKSIRVLVVYSI